MSDLTEQLYAGTLPTGHYYFNNGVETYIVLYKNINSKHLILQEPEELTVISGVPSYEEWQAKLEENTKLKEQLEIAVKRIEFLKKKTGAPYYGNTTYLKTIYQMCDKTLRQIQELEK